MVQYEMLLELREFLNEHVYTCFFTNYYFEHAGQKLNDYTELAELNLQEDPKIYMRPCKICPSVLMIVSGREIRWEECEGSYPESQGYSEQSTSIIGSDWAATATSDHTSVIVTTARGRGRYKQSGRAASNRVKQWGRKEAAAVEWVWGEAEEELWRVYGYHWTWVQERYPYARQEWSLIA